jgi:rSAM/selenodomain-associated transferase 1
MAAEPAGAAASVSDVLLLQFARAPVVGAVKTRMMPHLSAEQACALHSELVLWTCRQLVTSGYGTVHLTVAGDTDHPLFDRCRGLGAAAITRQVGGDLGERMGNALAAALTNYGRVVLVGSDCPSIDRAYLALALRGLDQQSLVLGPAADGGYVLIGARTVCPEMFEAIPWGTGEVYAETARRLRQCGRSWEELPALADIDRPADLAGWRALQLAAAAD